MNVKVDPIFFKVLAKKWLIQEVYLFGSAVRSDFSSSSDIDVMILLKKEATWGLFDLVDLKDELESYFKRKVDIVEKQVVVQRRNPVKSQEILTEAELIYNEAA